MKNRFLFPFLLILVFNAAAQQDELKDLNGRVVAEGRDVVGVVIQNISSKKAVITDVNGNFSIQVQLNDTLAFSAVHFKRKMLPVNEVIFNTNFITVPLEEFVNELREVVVQPYNLSGDLNQDVSNLDLPKDVGAEALGLPNANVKVITQSERKLQEASSGMYSLSRPLAVGLNPIINAITGRTKMLKNRVKVDEKYARTQRVQDFYVDSLFVATLKIPLEKVDDFMYFCEVDEEFQEVVDSKDKLLIWDFMVLKSRAYRENNKLD
ncbi:hypothetical protein [Flagellimonas nanhaiensis]|uniref:Carboxypeptidase-like regulatory domain-containing protein n=1 Tax=Flagellimonas nanhaiensis TaxID=2292706 RepID=A0A371JLZ9_9FLAO|nr:hypothetical protein [Allomuricauda nanhaiensis]RDY58100.1 hypothetical protein DX873_16370 [Allomuricauda nanhaiensis]